jgi:hypothetical protein
MTTNLLFASARQSPWIIVMILSTCGLAAASEPPLTAHVDPRVELVGIVFRLTGEDSDYNKRYLKQYAADIDAYFSPYKNHPAVALAKRLAQRDDFDASAPMQIAVRVSAPPALEPLLPFSDNVPGAGFDKQTALLFLQQLRDFYRDTQFEKFLAAHRAFYRLAEDRFNVVLRDVDLNWYAKFYGETNKSKYNLILALNNGGSNFGAQYTLPDGNEERFSIMGSWTADNSGDPTFSDGTYLDTVIHEFNHSFVNPDFDHHKSEFAMAQKVFDQVSGQIRGLGYANSDEMVYESLVRVNVILYLESKGRSRAEIEAKIREEQKKGFLWMNDLFDLMHEYTAQRSRYRTFDSFMPVVAQFYRDLSPRLPEMKADFYKKYVHVTSVEPFANHSRSVDPATQEIIVKFDKPLVCCQYSINYGPDGKEHFPLTGKVNFVAGNQSLKLGVTLKPGWHYSLTLTDESFSSQDGFPLEPYTIDFDTKP